MTQNNHELENYTMGPDIEWERYEYTTPKGNKIEVIREIVYEDEPYFYEE